VGVSQPTLQSAEFVNGVISVSEILPTFLQNRPNVGDGDGTVPQVSATPVQMSDLEMLSVVDYIAESHGALQNQPNVLLNLLKGLQTAQTAPLEDVRGSFESIARGTRSGVKGIGLSLEDLYLVNEPVTLRAKVSGDVSFSSLSAEITAVSEGSGAIIQNFIHENGAWVMMIDNLKAGLYEVKVKTDNTGDDAPNPVHNLFEVADLKDV
jgi:hypothetical protein